MRQKESYTLDELYDNLEITLTELSKLSGMSHGTLTRIRDKETARRSTVNKLLRVFSEIYAVELSIDNVTGIALEDKPAKIPALNIEQKSVHTSSVPMPSLSQDGVSQNRSTERKKADIPDDLPQGTVKVIDFIEKYNLPESNMSRWTNPQKGIKKGEWIETTSRNRASGLGKQHYLTPAQQEKALEVLKRHGKLKNPEPEQKQDEEPAWYLPD